MFYGTILTTFLYLKPFISKPTFFLLGTSLKFGELKMNVILCPVSSILLRIRKHVCWSILEFFKEN